MKEYDAIRILDRYIDHPNHSTIKKIAIELGSSEKCVESFLHKKGIYKKIDNILVPNENLISIVIPVYNVEKYLRRCLDSILKQSFGKFEIIAVDDGSDDSSSKILEKYTHQSNRLKVITQKNQGLSGARNTGIKNSHGDYIIFVDSDDYIEENLLRDVMKFTLINTLDICVYGYSRLTSDLKHISSTFFEDKIFEQDDARASIISLNVSPMACNKLYRKDLFTLSKIYFPVNRLHEDIGTTYRLFWESNRIGQKSQSYYNWVIREESITGSLTDKHIYDVFIHFTNTKKYLLARDEYNKYESSYIRGVFKICNILLDRINNSSIKDRLFDTFKNCIIKNDLVTHKNVMILKNQDEFLFNNCLNKTFRLDKRNSEQTYSDSSSLQIKWILSSFWLKLCKYIEKEKIYMSLIDKQVKLRQHGDYINFYIEKSYLGLFCPKKGELSDHRAIIRRNRIKVDSTNLYIELRISLFCLLNHFLSEKYFFKANELEKIKALMVSNSENNLLRMSKELNI